MNVKVTAEFDIENVIDEEQLEEAYKGDLFNCVINVIKDNGINIIENLKIIKVERKNGKRIV